MRPLATKGISMITRRSGLLSAAGVPLSAPATVLFTNLMPVRSSRSYVRRPEKIGLIDRRHILIISPRIAAWQKAGLSAQEIADHLAAAAAKSPFALVEPWSAQLVKSTIREGRAQIRLTKPSTSNSSIRQLTGASNNLFRISQAP
jgi:hypothetical protein